MEPGIKYGAVPCGDGPLRRENRGGSQGQRPVGSGMVDGEDGFSKIGKKNAAERLVNAHAAFLVGNPYNGLQ